MKIRIEERLGQSETEILILCEKQNEETDRIKTHLGMLEKTLLGKKQDRQVVLRPKDVLYFESVDDKVFATTPNDLIELKEKLYELENLLAGSTFLRVNKTTILDTAKIISFRALINGKMLATLFNREQIEITRTYVAELKQALGGLHR